ncbi:energy transducer TonB [Rouxiella aceris]|uniref:energy transducer TonB n=1 Tax=Rouxiella aceris TaxID=2703884 RepID=UPI0034D9773B
MLDGGKLHGIVTAEICVDQHGKVVRIKILRGHPIAYQPVLESVRSWRFAPYKVNGHAVPVVTELEVPFDFRTLPRANQSSKVD